MHQSTTPSLSQTIWPRWASRHFLSFPIVGIFLPVTFGYSLNSEVETIEEMKEAETEVIDTLTEEDCHGALQKLFERYNEWIATGGDYFEEFHVYTINKSAHPKKVWRLI